MLLHLVVYVENEPLVRDGELALHHYCRYSYIRWDLPDSNFSFNLGSIQLPYCTPKWFLRFKMIVYKHSKIQRPKPNCLRGTLYKPAHYCDVTTRGHPSINKHTCTTRKRFCALRHTFLLLFVNPTVPSPLKTTYIALVENFARTGGFILVQLLFGW